MAYLTSTNLAKDICAALGLDPLEVRSLEFRIALNDVATVTVERILLQDEGRGICQVLSQYELKLKHDGGDGG